MYYLAYFLGLVRFAFQMTMKMSAIFPTVKGVLVHPDLLNLLFQSQNLPVSEAYGL